MSRFRRKGNIAPTRKCARLAKASGRPRAPFVFHRTAECTPCGNLAAGFASSALCARKQRFLRAVQCGRYARAKRKRIALRPMGRAISPGAADAPRAHNELQSLNRNLLSDPRKFHRSRRTELWVARSHTLQTPAVLGE